MVVDSSGITVRVLFPAEAWEQFRKFVDDPEGETAKALARSKIVTAGGLAPSVKGRQH